MSYQDFINDTKSSIVKHGRSITLAPHSHAYTIGMAHANLPDVIITAPLRPETMQVILNWVCDKLVDGTFKAGLNSEYIENFNVFIAPCTENMAEFHAEYVAQADVYYQRAEMVSTKGFLQVVFPDSNGNFPWDNEYGGMTQPLFVLKYQN